MDAVGPSGHAGRPHGTVAPCRSIRRAVEQDGVTYNVYGDPKGTDRPWEVDLLPFVISAEEWQFLAKGLAQRARLLNLVLADFTALTGCSPRADPPAIIHGHHNYLWPCRSIDRRAALSCTFTPAISRARPMADGG